MDLLKNDFIHFGIVGALLGAFWWVFFEPIIASAFKWIRSLRNPAAVLDFFKIAFWGALGARLLTSLLSGRLPGDVSRTMVLHPVSTFAASLLGLSTLARLIGAPSTTAESRTDTASQASNSPGKANCPAQAETLHHG